MAKRATKSATAPRKRASKAAPGMDVQSGMDPNAEVTISNADALQRQFAAADAAGKPTKDEQHALDMAAQRSVRGF